MSNTPKSNQNKATKMKKKKPSSPLFCLLLLIFLSSHIRISMADPNNLFDTCPAAIKPTMFINGFHCKNPTTIAASDFSSAKLAGPVDVDDRFGSSVKMLTVVDFLGLNTLGLAVARTDLGIDGGVSLHSHPRATEMFFVNQGIVLAGFIDTNNRLFQSFLRAGDVIIFPRGLLHFCLNSGYETASIFSVFNSQNPGTVTINGAMFLPPPASASAHDPLMEFQHQYLLERIKSLFSLSDLKFDPNVSFPTAFLSL